MIDKKNKYLYKYNNLNLEKNILYICNNEYNYFLNKKNVLGIGCGYKVKNSFRTNKLCIQVFVSKKTNELNLLYYDIIPSNFKGISTDVIETNVFSLCSLTSKIRPVVGGYGVSAINYKNYGTAGCLVSNGISDFLLSTNHTIAGENEFIIGTPITEPAYSFGGKHPTDTIATLNKYIPLRFIHGEHQPINLSDCALGLLQKPNILTSEIAFIGNLKGVKRPILGEQVKKVGSTTELTTGTVTSIDASILISVATGRQCLFNNLIFTTPMTRLGDSGSILVNRYNYGLGLHFAGTNNVSAYCCLDIVLDQLNVHLVT